MVWQKHVIFFTGSFKRNIIGEKIILNRNHKLIHSIKFMSKKLTLKAKILNEGFSS